MAQEAIKYGDVFEMSGELADMPISPRDAAAMQSAENRAFGKTLKGGPAEIMHSAASKNLEAGLVGANDDSGVFPGYQTDAKRMLSHDKPVKRQDAELVTAAELREDTAGGVVIREPQRNPATLPGGVADTVAMAARLNEP